MRRGVVAAGAAGGGLVGDVVVVVAGREAVMGAGAVVVLRVCVRVAHWGCSSRRGGVAGLRGAPRARLGAVELLFLGRYHSTLTRWGPAYLTLIAGVQVGRAGVGVA